jgi:ribonuclease P protein component
VCCPGAGAAVASGSPPDGDGRRRAVAEIARLKRRAEFLRVASSRRKSVTPGLILQILHRPECDEPVGEAGQLRIGFTASRKVGIAVVRNRARRRLKAAVDRLMPLHAAAGHDYVLVARGTTAQRPFAALLGDLETALRRLGAWRGGGER